MLITLAKYCKNTQSMIDTILALALFILDIIQFD